MLSVVLGVVTVVDGVVYSKANKTKLDESSKELKKLALILTEEVVDCVVVG